MASLDNSRTLVDGHTIAGRLGNLLSRIVGAIAAWNDARVTRNALSRLSDHELNDLGLTRDNIDKISKSSAR